MSAKPPTHRAAFWIHAAFVFTGIVNTLLGPILPELAKNWSLQHADAGAMFTAQFSGSIAGALLLSRAAPRWGYPVMLVVGLALMATGVAALTWLAWPVALLAALTFGVGLGFTIPAGNLLVAESTSERAASAVSLLNVAWGIGAVVWPPLVALAGPARVHVLLLGVAAAVTVSGAAIAVMVARGWKQPAGPFESQVSAATAPPGRATGFWGLLFFLYVGTETALAGWSATYAQSLSGASSPAWVLTPAFVWAPLVIGRLVAPLVLRHASEEAVFRGGLLLALVGLVFLPYAGGRIAVVAAVSLGGLGLAPLFPLLMASLARRFGRDAARIGGLMFALCGLGGATVPWLVGVVSSRAGSMRAGLSVLVASTALLFAIHVAMQRRAASDV